MKSIELKEIIVVTDGRSNIGGDPAIAAQKASDESIIVSAVGIGSDEYDETTDEIKRIAAMGRGEWDLTPIQNLSHTLQLVTQKTINKTINGVVNKQLKEILGGDIEEMRPQNRSKFIKYIQDLSDEISLKCCILMDCSGSMKPKLAIAKESIIDLMNSLEGRKGKSEVSVIAYPGESGEKTKLITDFTDDIGVVKERILSMQANGTTPTASAIYRALELFKNKDDIWEDKLEEEPAFSESIV